MCSGCVQDWSRGTRQVSMDGANKGLCVVLSALMFTSTICLVPCRHQLTAA